MTWRFISDESIHLKGHFCSSAVADRLMADLSARYQCALKIGEPLTEVHFEPGGYGMYAMNQPKHKLAINDVHIVIESAKAEELIMDLTNAKVKTMADGTDYYKLYSRFKCLVLLPTEREQLLFAAKTALKDCQKESAEFFDAFEKSWEERKKEYEEKHGQPFPVIRAQDLQKDKPKN